MGSQPKDWHGLTIPSTAAAPSTLTIGSQVDVDVRAGRLVRRSSTDRRRHRSTVARIPSNSLNTRSPSLPLTFLWFQCRTKRISTRNPSTHQFNSSSFQYITKHITKYITKSKSKKKRKKKKPKS